MTVSLNRGGESMLVQSNRCVKKVLHGCARSAAFRRRAGREGGARTDHLHAATVGETGA
jgi:hypothetical protein